MKAELEALKSRLLAEIENHVEYETKHDDAGGNILDACLSDWWPEPGCDVWRFVQDLGLRDSVVKRIVQHRSFRRAVKDACEAYSGSMFLPAFSDRVIVDSWSVGEIECQVEVESPADLARLRWMERHDRELCLRVHGKHGYLYEATDTVWYATIDCDALRRIVTDTVCLLARGR